jgi:AbrB family looped-hinge helix DNA binding protein
VALENQGKILNLQVWLEADAMQTTSVSSKGQIIIPKALREAHRWHAGTRLEIQHTAEGLLLRPVVETTRVPLAAGLEAIRARIAYKGPSVSIEDMHSAVVHEAKRRSRAAAGRVNRKAGKRK